MKHSTIDDRELDGKLNRYGPTSVRTGTSHGKRLSSRTVDAHAHLAISKAAEYMSPHVDVSKIPMVRFSNEETNEINSKQEKDRIPVAMQDKDDRLKVLDAQGIDMQIVSPPPPQCYYQSETEHAVKGSQLVNDGIAEWVGATSDRFMGLGTVPMQDPSEAVKELTRCVSDLNLKGAMLLTNVDGKEIAADEFRPFWKKAEELGALIMIHPNGYTEGDRLMEYYFSNVVGNPLDTTVALHYLIFNGVLRDYPELRMLAVHGGGYLPSYSARIDHAWGARKDSHGNLPKPPTEYLRQVYFDSVVFSHHQLEYLVGLYGSDHIVMGSDYPFDMADYDPVGHIASSGLSEEDKSNVAGMSILRLLEMDV